MKYLARVFAIAIAGVFGGMACMVGAFWCFALVVLAPVAALGKTKLKLNGKEV